MLYSWHKEGSRFSSWYVNFRSQGPCNRKKVGFMNSIKRALLSTCNSDSFTCVQSQLFCSINM